MKDRCLHTVDLELGTTDAELAPFDERAQLSIFGASQLTLDQAAPAEFRLVLLGCVSKKRTPKPQTVRNIHGETWEIPGRMPAKDLYCSPLWEKRRRYAEDSGETWAIVSALWGVIENDKPIAWYEKTLTDVAKNSHAWRWDLEQKISTGIARIVKAAGIEWGAPVVLELHAGAPYVRKVQAALEWAGFDHVRIEHPVEGKQIGELLAWYNDQGAQ